MSDRALVAGPGGGPPVPPPTPLRVARTAAVLPIRLYRRIVSPLLGPRCRYYPSCSVYAEQAVQRYGILRGLVLAGWRLLRCNPWSRGGFDPVEDQTLFPMSGSSPTAH